MVASTHKKEIQFFFANNEVIAIKSNQYIINLLLLIYLCCERNWERHEKLESNTHLQFFYDGKSKIGLNNVKMYENV